jgi:hypothetical protein
MSRFLLAGPAKIGKSVAANRIANALGCAHIKYEWDGIEALPDSVLAVTTDKNIRADKWQQHLETRERLLMTIFIVDTSEALQALVEALEYQQVPHKQFHAAKKLANIAAWLDGHKSYLGSHEQRQEASDHIETLHTLAMNTAAYRIAEIYSPE